MNSFLKPTKITIVIYILLLFNLVHFILGKLIVFCTDPLSLCAATLNDTIYIITSFALLPVKLFSWPLDLITNIINPIFSSLILLFVYYLYSSFLSYLFKNYKKIFYSILIILPITSIIIFLIINRSAL